MAEIWDYIAADSIEHADRLIDLIDTKFKVLADQPGMGRSRSELATDLHSFAFGNYTIFYVPLSNGIDVVRVLHGARDIGTVLTEEQ